MSNLKLFEEKKVRSQWDAEQEKWYFSIVDVVAILTDSPDARNYWKVLQHRLIKEGNQSVTNCNQLKMQSSDRETTSTSVAKTALLDFYTEHGNNLRFLSTKNTKGHEERQSS